MYMGWRTVVINSNCKLSYKNDYLLIRNDELKMIHLSEIDSIIIENGMVSITSYLISELTEKKIKLIFCDEKHNPTCEMMPYYSSFNTSKKIQSQINWKKDQKESAWQKIVEYKIYNQAMVLKKLDISGYEKIIEYSKNVEIGDCTNREGHSAKVYFNLLFGKEFTRDGYDNRNIALNYGYTILLSMINREIVNRGYITPIGVNHKNEFNQFNLSCDLMEIFRPIVDVIVFKNGDRELDTEYKHESINITNFKIKILKKEYFLANGISIILNSIFNFLEERDNNILNYEF